MEIQIHEAFNLIYMAACALYKIYNTCHVCEKDRTKRSHKVVAHNLCHKSRYFGGFREAPTACNIVSLCLEKNRM